MTDKDSPVFRVFELQRSESRGRVVGSKVTLHLREGLTVRLQYVRSHSKQQVLLVFKLKFKHNVNKGGSRATENKKGSAIQGHNDWQGHELQGRAAF